VVEQQVQWVGCIFVPTQNHTSLRPVHAAPERNFHRELVVTNLYWCSLFNRVRDGRHYPVLVFPCSKLNSYIFYELIDSRMLLFSGCHYSGGSAKLLNIAAPEQIDMRVVNT
jgi:hypothetical protein